MFSTTYTFLIGKIRDIRNYNETCFLSMSASVAGVVAAAKHLAKAA